MSRDICLVVMDIKVDPEDWAMGTAALTDDAHANRIRKCIREEYLLAAVRYEATRRVTRQDRVARINQRLATIREYDL